MWRIYASPAPGVKIRTTIGRLLKAIYDTQDLNADRKYWIGKVKYENQDEIVATLQGLLSNPDHALTFVTDCTFLSTASILLFKREAFAYEQEIRLIFRADDDRGHDERTFAIDPNNLIDEVVFDPRMEGHQFEECRTQLQNLGYTGRIDRSTLYDLPFIDAG
jgi:hypothetical protein